MLVTEKQAHNKRCCEDPKQKCDGTNCMGWREEIEMVDIDTPGDASGAPKLAGLKRNNTSASAMKPNLGNMNIRQQKEQPTGRGYCGKAYPDGVSIKIVDS